MFSLIMLNVLFPKATIVLSKSLTKFISVKNYHVAMQYTCVCFAISFVICISLVISSSFYYFRLGYSLHNSYCGTEHLLTLAAGGTGCHTGCHNDFRC